eukprot:11519788-Alexandrium_andersonii.AAC.1
MPFGAGVAADQAIAAPASSHGLRGEMLALRVRDLGTGFVVVHPGTSRASDRAGFAVCQSHGRRKRGRLHTDGAIEHRRVARGAFLPRSASAPGRSETDAVAERNAQTLSTRARALLE